MAHTIQFISLFYSFEVISLLIELTADQSLAERFSVEPMEKDIILSVTLRYRSSFDFAVSTRFNGSMLLGFDIRFFFCVENVDASKKSIDVESISTLTKTSKMLQHFVTIDVKTLPSVRDVIQ